MADVLKLDDYRRVDAKPVGVWNVIDTKTGEILEQGILFDKPKNDTEPPEGVKKNE